MTKNFVILFALLVSGVFSSCANPEEKANTLYVEASQILKQAREVEKTSFTSAFTMYAEALSKLEAITSKYPSASLAVRLAEGESVMESYSLSEFRDTFIPQAKLKAEAEYSPLSCAVLMIHKLSDDEEDVGSGLSQIVTQCVHSGRFDEALEIIDSTNTESQIRLLLGFSSELLQTANTGTASDALLRVLHLLESEQRPPGEKAHLLSEVAQQYVQLGHVEQAQQIADSLASPSLKVHILTKIAAWYAQSDEIGPAADNLDQAVQVARGISDPDAKGSVLAQIAGQYVHAGKRDAASSLLSQALELVERMKYDWSKVEVLIDVASGYIDLGQGGTALDLLSRAIRINRKATAGSSCIGLVRIAHYYAEAGEQEEAENALSQAIQTAKTARSEYWRDMHLKAMVEECEKLEDFEVALQVARRVESENSRNHVLSQLAEWCTVTGRQDEAYVLLEEISDSRRKWKTLIGIARKRAEEGQEEGAREDLARVLGLLEPTMSPWMRAAELNSVADVYLHLGDDQRAEEILAEARGLCDEIRGGESETEILIKTGSQYAQLGDSESASVLLSQAFQDVRTMAASEERALMMAKIGIQYGGADLRPDEKMREGLFEIVNGF